MVLEHMTYRETCFREDGERCHLKNPISEMLIFSYLNPWFLVNTVLFQDAATHELCCGYPRGRVS